MKKIFSLAFVCTALNAAAQTVKPAISRDEAIESKVANQSVSFKCTETKRLQRRM